MRHRHGFGGRLRCPVRCGDRIGDIGLGLPEKAAQPGVAEHRRPCADRCEEEHKNPGQHDAQIAGLAADGRSVDLGGAGAENGQPLPFAMGGFDLGAGRFPGAGCRGVGFGFRIRGCLAGQSRQKGACQACAFVALRRRLWRGGRDEGRRRQCGRAVACAGGCAVLSGHKGRGCARCRGVILGFGICRTPQIAGQARPPFRAHFGKRGQFCHDGLFGGERRFGAVAPGGKPGQRRGVVRRRILRGGRDQWIDVRGLIWRQRGVGHIRFRRIRVRREGFCHFG